MMFDISRLSTGGSDTGIYLRGDVRVLAEMRTDHPEWRKYRQLFLLAEDLYFAAKDMEAGVREAVTALNRGGCAAPIELGAGAEKFRRICKVLGEQT